jgi:small subunit ribosomal protein S9
MDKKIIKEDQKKIIGIGRRKSAIAQVFLFPGKGKFIINRIPEKDYLQFDLINLTKIREPLKKLNLEKQFNIIVKVKGGGLHGQSDAIQLGLARALCKYNIQHRQILKPFNFLRRDSRIKERKKYGLRKARKASQYSKR